MVSIKQKKLISSLAHKKYREKHGLFVLEGDKVVRNALEQNENNLVKIEEIHATGDWIRSLPELSERSHNIIHEASDDELKAVSSMLTSPGVIALARIPALEFQNTLLKDEITLVLDSIRDPGNLGTIIRTTDWFGFNNIICSPDCVDAYNPKVVQASMGAILRVNIYYESVPIIIENLKRMKVRLFGTSLDGSNFYDTYIKRPAAIVFGNESKGISQEFLKVVDEKILIPNSYGDHSGSESLNVGSSVAIMCAEIRRRGI